MLIGTETPMTRVRRVRIWCGAAATVLALSAAATVRPGGDPAGEAGGPGASPLWAAEATALPRFLESVQVGTATEFRLAVVHPVFVPQAEAAAPRAEDAPPVPVPPAPPQSWAGTPRDAVGVELSARDGRSAARVTNLGLRPLWAFPGDVLRLGDGDFAVRADTLVAAGRTEDVPVLRVATVSGDERGPQDPRWVGTLPGPALLWTLLAGGHDRHVVQACADLAADAGLATTRRSPVELAGAAKIAARVAEYRLKLAAIPKPAAAGKRAWAGYAIVLDGAFAGFEVFADAKEFEAVWPSRIEGIAVEAALAEIDDNVFDSEIAPPKDPDRHTALVKDAMLALYGLTPEPRRVPGLGSVLPLKKGDDVGRAVVDDSGAPRHVLWLRDPAHRRTTSDTSETPLSPGVIDRKGRPTEAEKRWRERRGKTGE